MGYSENDLESLHREIKELQQKIEYLDNEKEYYRNRYQDIKLTLSWKVTAPLRAILIRCQPIKRILKTTKYLVKHGWKKTIHELSCARREVLYEDMFVDSKKDRMMHQELIFSVPIHFLLVLDLRDIKVEDSEITECVKRIEEQTYTDFEMVFLAEDGKIIQSLSHLNCKMVKPEGLKEYALGHGEYTIICKGLVMLQPDMLYYWMKELSVGENNSVIYADNLLYHEETKNLVQHEFKMDYSLYTLENCNYIGNVFGVSTDALQKCTLNIEKYRKNWHYDLLLQLTETEENFGHISKALYEERLDNANLSEQDKEELIAIVQTHMCRQNKKAALEKGQCEKGVHIQYEITNNPLVSIIIPTCDHQEDLKKCVDSILQKTSYTNYEILIIENNSKKKQTFSYYEEIKQNKKVKVLTWEKAFNYSAINNFGVGQSKGDYLLFLNNDVQIINPQWMEEMLQYSIQPDVGAVGVKLYFPDDTIQHAGVILGIRGLAGHGHRGFEKNADGYMNRLKIVSEYLILTAACLMISREKFDEVGGFDEELAVDYNDVDFCMKLYAKGYHNLYTPYAQLYHFESKSRGANVTKEKLERVERETKHFQVKWMKRLNQGDPFYNENLTLEKDDFTLRTCL